VKTGKILREYKGISALQAAFYPTIPFFVTADGRRAIFYSAESKDANELIVWHLESGAVIHRHKIETYIDILTATPDGRKAANLSVDGGTSTVTIVDFETGQVVTGLKIPLEGIKVLTITPDGSKIILGTNKSTVIIWDLQTCTETMLGTHGTDNFWRAGQPDGSFHPSRIYFLAVVSNGKELVSVSTDGYMIIWDLISRQILRKLQIFKGSPGMFTQPVSVTPDGSKAVSASTDNNCIRLWDLRQKGGGESSTTLAYRVVHVAITPDGSKAISGYEDGTLRIWDNVKGEIINEFKANYKEIKSVAISRDGSRAYSGSHDTVRSQDIIETWDLKKGELLDTLDPGAMVLAISSDGRRSLLSNISNKGEFKSLSLKTGKIEHEFKFGIETTKLAISSDSGMAVFAIGSSVYYANLVTGAWIEIKGIMAEEFEETFNSIAISSDGRWVAGGSDDGTSIADIGALKKLVFSASDIKISRLPISNMQAIANGGGMVLLGSPDRKLRLFDLNRKMQDTIGELIATFVADYNLESCDISEDGSVIIAGDWGGMLHILHLERHGKNTSANTSTSSNTISKFWKKFTKR
jgi:WD40 repeat protein